LDKRAQTLTLAYRSQGKVEGGHWGFSFLPQFGQLRSVAGIGCWQPEHFSVILVS
jgi:hypothetical protein